MSEFKNPNHPSLFVAKSVEIEPTHERDTQTNKKASEILKKILDLVNKDKPVTFSDDGKSDYAITLTISEDGHTHCGWEGATFDQFVDSLHDTMCSGGGLSLEQN